MIESFEIIIKEFATQAVVERDTENSHVCVTWYNLVDGKKEFREKNCNERMTHEDFIKFKNQMRCYHQIIE